MNSIGLTDFIVNEVNMNAKAIIFKYEYLLCTLKLGLILLSNKYGKVKMFLNH